METPFHLAVKARDIKAIKRLLADGEIIDARFHGQTALHMALELGFADVVQSLLAHGACAIAKDAKGNTPLHYAARKGMHAIGALLIRKGANVDVVNDARETPLHCAARIAHLDTIKLLMQNGAELNRLDIYGNSPPGLAYLANSVAALDIMMSE